MKCIKCKKKIPDNSKFCNHCGAKQKNEKLYRRPDGLYEKSININGKRKVFRAKSEKEVFEKIYNYNETAEELKQGLPFSKIADEYEEVIMEELAYSTIVSYKPKIARAKAHFGNQPITKITIRNINNYINKFPKSWGFKTANGYLSVLKLIFKYAAINEYVINNPCSLVSVPKGLKKEHRRSVTKNEMDIINKSINEPGGLIAYFILYTGLRRGEAMALKWSDIDFKNQTISISKSVSWHGNEPHIKEPKTEKGKRKVVLLDCLSKVILPLKKGKNDLVFPDENGELYRNSKLTRLWDRWKKATGLFDVTPHMIRHGYSTILFEAGLQAKDMQDLMGHAQFSTTMDVYTDILTERKEETRNKLNTYLNTKITQYTSKT